MNTKKMATDPRRLQPPNTMPKGAKLLWADIVNSMPPDEWEPRDSPGLEAYVLAWWKHRAEMAKDARKAGSGDPVVIRECVATLKALGPQLRLAKSARQGAQKAETAARRQQSTPGAAVVDGVDWRAELPN